MLVCYLDHTHGEAGGARESDGRKGATKLREEAKERINLPLVSNKRQYLVIPCLQAAPRLKLIQDRGNAHVVRGRWRRSEQKCCK